MLLLSEIAAEAQLSPEEEKAKHLKQVKEDNLEIAGFENQIRDLKGKIEHCQEEITRCEDSLVDQDSHEVNGCGFSGLSPNNHTLVFTFPNPYTLSYNQAKKYKELKKREEQMDDFLEKFEVLRAEEGESKKIHEENIVKLLEAISTGT